MCNEADEPLPIQAKQPGTFFKKNEKSSDPIIGFCEAEALFREIDEEVESLREENESLNEVISDLQLDVPEADEDLPF